MAIREIIAAINERLPYDTIVSEPGAEASETNEDPNAPRVVLVPTTVRYTSPRAPGMLPPGTMPNVVDRLQGFEARISAGDYSAVEALEAAVINALNEVLGPAEQWLDAGRWLETGEELRGAQELRIMFAVRIPVQRTAPTTRRPAYEPITPTLESVGA